MSKRRVKLIIFLAAAPIIAVLGLVALRGLSGFIASFQEGANPASIFHGAELRIPYSDQALWLDDMGDTGKTPTSAQREELIAAYWNAWSALERNYLTGNAEDLTTYWAGGAFDQLRIEPGTKLRQASSGHQLRLRFFADDGTVAAFDDLDFQITQTLGSETLTFSVNAAVIMTLDNGYWRIRSITVDYSESR